MDFHCLVNAGDEVFDLCETNMKGSGTQLGSNKGRERITRPIAQPLLEFRGKVDD